MKVNMKFFRHCQHPRLLQALCLVLFALPINSLVAKEQVEKKISSVAPEYARQIMNIDIPKVDVTRKDGKKLPFNNELDDGRPVIMNFIFTSCSAICPMLSHLFSQVQSKLDKTNQSVHLVSVSIDPENDTAKTLSEYAKKFGAGANWDHYTSSLADNIAIQKAFNVFRGDKMNHASVVLMRTKPGQPWLRLEGFMSSDNITNELDLLKNDLKADNH
jgi:protein SCO1/2